MDCLICGGEHSEWEHNNRRKFRHPEVNSISVARWPWCDEVIFSTWRDQQAAFFNRRVRERNTKRVILAAVVVAALIAAAWVTI